MATLTSESMTFFRCKRNKITIRDTRGFCQSLNEVNLKISRRNKQNGMHEYIP